MPKVIERLLLLDNGSNGTSRLPVRLAALPGSSAISSGITIPPLNNAAQEKGIMFARAPFCGEPVFLFFHTNPQRCTRLRHCFVHIRRVQS